MSRKSIQLLSGPQLDALKGAFERGLRPLKTEAPMRCSEWARKHFWLSAESSGSGTEGPFDPWPHQTAILDCMGSDEISVVTFRKSAGIGYTKMLSAAVGYYHHHKKRNTLIYQPTDQDAKEFCKDTIDPLIRDSAVMSELMTGSGKNSKENTLHTKYFLGSSLHIRGGTSSNNYRRLRKDVVVYDELDGFDVDIDGEGDPVSLGDKRVRDSAFPKSIRGTTPTTVGRSNIQKSEQDADLLFSYYIECPDCGHYQPLEFGGKDIEHGIKWTDDDPNTAHYVCRSCLDHWDYSQLPELLSGGRWQAPDGSYIDRTSRLRNDQDKPLKWPDHVAFLIWSAYSLTFPWSLIVREFLAANNDPVLLKTFVNTTLGEYWKDTITQVEADPLLERRENYSLVPDGVIAMTFGADVQADRIECEFVGWGIGEESWSIDYQIIPGDPTRQELWSRFHDLITRKFKTESGQDIKASIGCVDSGYLTDEVYAFSRRAGVRFAVPVKGQSVANKPIASFPRKLSKDKRVYLTPVGTDNAKDVIYRRLLIDQPGPGYCHYPNREVYDTEFFAQLTGEEKRSVMRQGRPALAFMQSYSNVEVLDCRVYALAAVKIAQDRFGLKLNPEFLQAVVSDKPKTVKSNASNFGASADWLGGGSKNWRI